MFTVLITGMTACMMLIAPPGVNEITKIETPERVEYRLPNGYGINDILISVPKGMEANGAREAEALLDILHQQRYVFMLDDIEVSVKARNRIMAEREVLRWFRIIGESL